MLKILKRLLGKGDPINFRQLLSDGATIIDVRSKGEFRQGHIAGAINIPVNELRQELHLLKDKNKPLITCCASGMRSAAAKKLLDANGYSLVVNGGSWTGLKNNI